MGRYMYSTGATIRLYCIVLKKPIQVCKLNNFCPSLGKGCAGGVSGFLENVVSTRVQVSTPHSLVPKSKVRPSTQNLSLIYRESTRDSSEISKIRQIRPKSAVLAQFLPHRKTQEKSVVMAPNLSSTLKNPVSAAKVASRKII